MSNTFIFMNAFAVGMVLGAIYGDWADRPLGARICFRLGVAMFMASFYFGKL